MDYVNLLKSYGGLVLAVLIVLLTIISMIVKKRPLNEIIDNSGWRDLVEYIIDAESKFGSGHGNEKMAFVLEKFYSSRKITKSQLSENLIKSCVEEILRTPERKDRK